LVVFIETFPFRQLTERAGILADAGHENSGAFIGRQRAITATRKTTGHAVTSMRSMKRLLAIGVAVKPKA
jgi:hypothetical protein